MQQALFGDETGGDGPTKRLVGVARLAASSEMRQEKRQVQYLSIPIRSVMTRCNSQRVPFAYTISPYRGCEFGCKYCYARYAHEFMELDTRSFETRIYAKERAADVLRAELRKMRPVSIGIGTATDPYQPAERRFRVTRAILEVLADRCTGFHISLVTKSDLVTRDIDLFQAIARRNAFEMSVTITTLDAALARALEPRAPRPELRLRAVKELSAAGISTGVIAAPVLPAITDNPKHLEAVARESAKNGARHFIANPLFLKPCAQKEFFPFLEKQFPHLLEAYTRRFEQSAFIRGPYVTRLRALVAHLRQEYGMTPRAHEYVPEAFDPQLALFPEPDPPLSQIAPFQK